MFKKVSTFFLMAATMVIILPSQSSAFVEGKTNITNETIAYSAMQNRRRNRRVNSTWSLPQTQRNRRMDRRDRYYGRQRSRDVRNRNYGQWRRQQNRNYGQWRRQQNRNIRTGRNVRVVRQPYYVNGRRYVRTVRVYR